METQNTIEDSNSVWSDEELYCKYFTHDEGNNNACIPDSGNIQEIESDSESASSENIPLADLSKRRKLPVKRKLISSETESEYDDSGDDKDYIPSKDDMNSSDSEYNSMQGSKKGKRRKTNKSNTCTAIDRDKGWKRKTKTIKVNKKRTMKTPTSNAAKKLKEKVKKLQNRRKKSASLVTDLNRAKQISKKLHTIQAIAKRAHLSRLDTLLSSNELYRVCTSGDGNCFFSSVVISGKIDENATELRTNICNFMSENAAQYLPFCGRNNTDFRDEDFLNELDLLKSAGQWNVDIADVVPLAVANYCRSTVRIYSSSLSTPVIDIQPDTPSDKTINLAYFFCKTLDVKRKTIDYTSRKTIHGTYSGSDMRGKAQSANKLDGDTIKKIKKHIESFQTMESHYSRQSTKKQYLSNDLNIKKMWTLYTKECEKKGIPAAKECMYRKTFCEEYNLSFYKPKKDQCSLCILYERRKKADTVDETLQKEYKEHLIQKQQAREEKARDKQRAQTNNSVYVATFDLQAVLTTPCSLVSELYYSRKLCCYNLTIYSLGDKQVFCHMWDESQCKRGSCEIATCLMKNTLYVCKRKDVQEIIYYSDSCGGQNRNKFVTASLLYALSQIKNLNVISHKFLQSGHSQMECDSVHSTIECAKKLTPVYVPSQWCTLVSMARKTKPYIAVPMKYNHVVDFKDFVKKYCTNLKVSVNERKSTGYKLNGSK